MASVCKSQQCSIERRGFRQELDSWRYKLIHCVGKLFFLHTYVRAHRLFCSYTTPPGVGGNPEPALSFAFTPSLGGGGVAVSEMNRKARAA